MTLRISRILHAGYLFDCEGTAVLFDPIFENPFSSNCHAFPGVRFDLEQVRALRPAAVFISHLHDDHCSMESLNLLDRATPIYMYCLFDELFAMIRELGFRHVHRLATDVPVHVAPFEIIPREAFDADVDSMFHIRAAGLNILNVVDAWMGPEVVEQLARFAPWDMVLWPFQTMLESDVLAPSRARPALPTLPEEWVPQLRALKPRYVVPSACQFVQEPWSWYNHAMFPITYLRFQRVIERLLPDTTVLRLNPSVSVDLDSNRVHLAPPLPWVIPVGEQDVDFVYDPQRPVPGTGAIARQFPALGPAETERVLQFCRVGLLETYRSLELSPDSFFMQPRRWRLTIYDHEGRPRTFFFALERDAIEASDDTELPLSWSTDVPMAKLYAALELGESLTSMYVRINDAVFDAATEADLAEADLIDDPLIRTLFNGAVGTFQLAQLKRIRQRERIQ